jgi:hypothetical protein
MLGCSCSDTNTSVKKNTASEENCVSLVDIGEEARLIPSIKDDSTLGERKKFVAAGKYLLEQLSDVLFKENFLQKNLCPHNKHGRELFLHFKPLVTLLKENHWLAVGEKNTQLAIQSVFLLINLGKAVCYGGNSEDQTMGFVFTTQGVVLLYKYLQTYPDNLDKVTSDLFTGLKDNIEEAVVTVARLPENDDRRSNGTIYKMSVKIQSDRILVMRACLEMCRIAYELERHKKVYGNYPQSLQDLKCSPPISVDSWSEPYVYIVDKNSYQLYSKGIDKIDNNGDTPSIIVLTQNGKGDIDISKIK